MPAPPRTGVGALAITILVLLGNLKAAAPASDWPLKQK